MFSLPTDRISHNCINGLSVNKDTEGDGERGSEREREFLLQPSEIIKNYKEDQLYKQSVQKNVICNCYCPMPSRATKSEPMRDHPGFYFCNWMLILWGVGSW